MTRQRWVSIKVLKIKVQYSLEIIGKAYNEEMLSEIKNGQLPYIIVQ